jgi:hypothetical protein
MILYAKFQCMNMHGFFVINYLKILLLGILYNAKMHTFEFGQAYWIYLLKRIISKLIWYFSEFCTIYYEFLKFKWISRVFNSEMNFKKLINVWTVLGRYSAHSVAWPAWRNGQSGPMAQAARCTVRLPSVRSPRSGPTRWRGCHRCGGGWTGIWSSRRAPQRHGRPAGQGEEDGVSPKAWGSGEVATGGSGRRVAS